MKTTRAHLIILGAALLLASTGCASIISGRHAEVAIDSYPSDAHVVVHDQRGRQVASLQTPGVVALKRQGRYFMPARYTATIEAPGYQAAEVPIRSTANPWILGNVVVGGIPGLIVDNATGAAWKPKHSEIHQELLPLCGPHEPSMYSASPPSRDDPAEVAHQLTDPAASKAAVHIGQREAEPTARY